MTDQLPATADLPPSAPSNDYLTSIAELEQHMATPDKQALHEKMLAQMGVNVDAIRAERRGGPSLFLAEQPGMFPAEYRNRMRLIEEIRGRFGDVLNDTHSGSHILSVDGYTAQGGKSIFSKLTPLPGESPVLTEAFFVSAAFRKENRNKAYDSITMTEVQKSMQETVGGLLTILQGSRRETTRAFQGELKTNAGAVQKFFPHSVTDKASEAKVELLMRELEKYDVPKAIAELELYLNVLGGNPEQTWSDYWTDVNSRVAGQELKNIDPLLSRLILAIDNPQQLGRWLGDNMNAVREPNDPLITAVPIAGYIGEDRRYKIAYYSPEQNAFFADNNCHKQIEWAQITDLAEKRQAVPAYILKYLMRAATDMYYFMDDHDTRYKTSHDRSIHGIYMQQTGLRYPIIKTPSGGPSQVPDVGYSLLGGYTLDEQDGTNFERVLERFERDMN